MTALHAPWALLPDGWTADVRVTLDPHGAIARVESGVAAAAADERLAARVLLPAPANLHSHAFQRALAGMSERRGAVPQDSFWSWRALMYRMLDALGPEQIEAITALAYVEMLEAGYGSVAEFHYLHHAPGGAPYAQLAETSARVFAAAVHSGIGLTHLPVLYQRGGFDEAPLAGGQLRFGGADFADYASLRDDVLRAARAAPADTRIGAAPHSLRAVRPAALRDLVALSGDAPCHIHVAEQPLEVEQMLAAHRQRPVRWLLDEIGIGNSWCLVHATHITADECAALAASGAVAGLAPVTEANLGDGLFPAADYLAAGGLFGVGTDSNVHISLSAELALLEYGQRLRGGRRAVLASETRSVGRTLFEAACQGGARALGRRCGRIAAGDWADLLTLDLDGIDLAPQHGDGWLDAWLFANGRQAVRDVWSAGRRCVSAGRHHQREAIESRYRATLQQLRSQL